MRVADLMERLEGLDPEAEVRIASQQSWPFEYSIMGAVLKSELPGREEDEDPPDLEDPYEGYEEEIIYLVEGTQLGYFTKEAWDACY